MKLAELKRICDDAQETVEIPLSQGYVALISACDYGFISKHKWSYDSGYASRSVFENGKTKKILMHREILGIRGTSAVCDHKDLNRLNNTRENLRVATPSQNQHNRNKLKGRLGSAPTSKYKGVSFCKQTKRWIVQICFKDKRIHIGRFDSELEAAQAYNKKAIDLYGQYANTNVLKDYEREFVE